MNKNKYGLSRSIPDSIKEQILRDAGFGCVICGQCPYEYEHIDPRFCDAKKHDPNRMTLLCGICHSKVTKGVFSKDKVFTAKRNPWCVENGHTCMGLDFTGEDIIFQIGDTVFINSQMPLTVSGKPILSAYYSEKQKSIIVNGYFYDNKGEKVGLIVNNEAFGVILDDVMRGVDKKLAC